MNELINGNLRHLADIQLLRFPTVQKIESARIELFALYDMEPKELGFLCSCDGQQIYAAIRTLVNLQLIII